MRSFVCTMIFLLVCSGCATKKIPVPHQVDQQVFDSLLSTTSSSENTHSLVLIENLHRRDLHVQPGNGYEDIAILKTGQRIFLELSKEFHEINLVLYEIPGLSSTWYNTLKFDLSDFINPSNLTLVECKFMGRVNPMCIQKNIDINTVKSVYLTPQLLHAPIKINGIKYDDFINANSTNSEHSWNTYLSSKPPRLYRHLAIKRLESVIAKNLEKLRNEQLCSVKYSDFIYTGKSCQDGLAHGPGTAVVTPGQGKRALDGEFVRGVFVKGRLLDRDGIKWYDGQVDSMLSPHGFGTLLGNSGEQIFKGNFVQGKAEGSGVCEYQGATEPCMYTAGRRTDQVHLIRIEVARMEKALADTRAERERAEKAWQEDQAREQRAARERADSNGGVRTNSWAADAINAINGGAALMQQQMDNDYSATQQLRQRESTPAVNWEQQRAAEAALAAKQAEMNRLLSNQSGANSGRMGSGYGGSLQDCGIELSRCGNDSVCRDQVSQSSICSNDNSSDDVKDCRHYGTCNDSRVKPNPNIK